MEFHPGKCAYKFSLASFTIPGLLLCILPVQNVLLWALVTPKSVWVFGDMWVSVFWGFLCFVEERSLEPGGSLLPQTVQHFSEGLFPSPQTFALGPGWAAGSRTHFCSVTKSLWKKH